MPGGPPAEGALVEEARRFARYVLGREAPAELLHRYVEASRLLFPEPPRGRDAAVLAFVRRHPWSLGPLDAASALVHGGGQLRSRLLVMTAILEASPGCADDFLPANVPAGRLFLGLAALGARAALKAAFGLLLYLPAARARA
jgi:hypothetical protein